MNDFLKLFELSSKQACLLSRYAETLERRPQPTAAISIQSEEMTIEDRLAERKAKEKADFLQREWLAELEVYYDAFMEISEEIQEILSSVFD